MDKEKFIKQMRTVATDIEPDYVNSIVEMTLDRVRNEDEEKMAEFIHGAKLPMVLMEETGELVEAVSRRLRGRDTDDYSILEESADVILDVLCICKYFGISTEDLQKALMVKCKRQEQKTSFD